MTKAWCYAHLVLPFQGDVESSVSPRALPWAGLCRTFGAQEIKCFSAFSVGNAFSAFSVFGGFGCFGPNMLPTQKRGVAGRGEDSAEPNAPVSSKSGKSLVLGSFCPDDALSLFLFRFHLGEGAEFFERFHSDAGDSA